ncbi:MAG: hypothetical protein DSZ23_01815 [Thermodesulfatator sp.]|nr:MAG: hypothetical protein DSZ23_01815 [Thermodesulfatator sp.]
MSQPLPRQFLNNFMGTVADCLDAFTAALFVYEPETRRLCLNQYHSLSDNIVPRAVIEEGHGFVSWVMKNQRALQVPRFNRDSRTLGFYSTDVGLKSFLAVPLPEMAGVLCVDSRSRFAFAQKHERILESLARTAYNFMVAEKGSLQARFYSSILKWQMTSHEDRRTALESLAELLGFEVAIAARHLVGTSFVVIEDIVQKGDASHVAMKFQGEKVPLGQGIAGWVARHESSILLERDSAQPRKGSLLVPDEPFMFGPVVAGVFCGNEGEDTLDVNYCFVFSGDADTSSWPGDILKVLEFLLKGRLPWH